MKSYILLENIIIYANHGVLPQETVVGNEFVINLKIGIDLSKAGQTDNLEDTVSYAEIYEDVKAEMAIPSKLLEHAAYRIVKRLRSKYEKIKSLEIKLSKRNPPMGAQIDYATVYLKDK